MNKIYYTTTFLLIVKYIFLKIRKLFIIKEKPIFGKKCNLESRVEDWCRLVVCQFLFKFWVNSYNNSTKNKPTFIILFYIYERVDFLHVLKYREFENAINPSFQSVGAFLVI